MQHLWRTKQTTAADYSPPRAEEVCGPGRGVQQPITKRTQTTGRRQTRQGTEPICSASRVSAQLSHAVQTGGPRSSPQLQKHHSSSRGLKKKKKGLQLALCPYSASSLHTCNTSLSLIVWREAKASQGGVEKKRKRSLTATSSTR